MKTLLNNIAWVFVSLLLFAACADENEALPEVGGDTITLKLENRKLSRSATNGEDKYNENTLAKIDVFIYKQGETDNCLSYSTGLAVTAGGTVQIKVPSALKNAPFTVYVIANLGAEFDYSNKSLSALQAGSISADFSLEKQNNFIMDGLKNVERIEGLNGQALVVELDRAASKITLAAQVDKEVTDASGQVWVPLLSNMKISFYKGVKNSHVNTEYQPFTTGAEDYIGEIMRDANLPTSDGKYTHIPFYSYSNNWANNTDNESYLLLTLLWKHKSAGNDAVNYIPYYYRIPINKENKELVRNYWYNIDLKVSILGSEIVTKPVELESTCKIIDWSSVAMDADLTSPKYLVVDEYNVVMNNLEEYTVKYASSSPISFQLKRVWRYNPPRKVGSQVFDDSKAEEIYDITEKVKADITFKDNGNGTFTITHKLLNDGKSNNEKNHFFRPWHFEFEVLSEHFSNTGEGEEVEVTQYPAIYIVADHNSDGVNNRFINANDGKNTLKGDTYDFLSDLSDLQVTNNWNLNQYVIYTTVLGNSYTGYVVGDPRDFSYINYDGMVSMDNGKTLTYYYPAKKEGAENIIAPAFRIASSWGQSPALAFDLARKRCAAYQENGYPAGRWRMPTEAEIKYMASLSQEFDKENGALRKDGFIPMLLNGTYWVSSGKGYSSGRGTLENDPGVAHARCVYDTWYWGNKSIDNKGQFVWGDERR